MSGSTYKLRCPDCKGPMRVRNSVYMHDLMRNVYVECQNINCGAAFGGHMEFTCRMSPSAEPNPNIDLPMADSAMRKAAAQKEAEKQMDIDELLEHETNQ